MPEETPHLPDETTVKWLLGAAGALLAGWPIIKSVLGLLAWIRPVSKQDYDSLCHRLTEVESRIKDMDPNLKQRVDNLETHEAQREEARTEKMEKRIEELTAKLQRRRGL